MKDIISINTAVPVFLCLATLLATDSFGCPNECACAAIVGDITVNCSYRKLTSFPALFDLAQASSPDSLSGQTDEQKIRLLANGNRFKHLLRSRLRGVASRLQVLEMAANEHVIDVTPDIFRDRAFGENLETLRLGPIHREYIAGLLKNTYRFSGLRELSITGDSSAYYSYKSRGGDSRNDEDLVLSAPSLPWTLRVLRLINCGTVFIAGEAHEEMPALTEITLSGVRLTSMPLLVIKLLPSSLERLDLSRNYLKDLWRGWGGGPTAPSAWEHSCALVSLNLSYNKLSHLAGHLLRPCVHLRSLDLSHNSLLGSISPDAFFGLSALNLDLSHTKVESLQGIPAGQVAELRVLSAGLACDCGLLTSEIFRLQRHSIKGTCRYVDPEVRGQVSEVSLDLLVLHCSGDTGRDPARASMLPSHGDVESGGNRFSILPSHSRIGGEINQGLDENGDGISEYGEGELGIKFAQEEHNGGKGEVSTDTAQDVHHVWTSDPSPALLHCWLCVCACLLHGALLFAAFFIAGHAVKK